MARGWESKSVEAQMEPAEEFSRLPRPRFTPDELERERKRDALLLQRTRVMHDLGRCTDERYRKTLETGLGYLETQLKALGWKR